MVGLTGILLLGFAAHLQAAEIRVRVELEDGSGVPGALVTVKDGGHNQLGSKTSDAMGEAGFQSIPEGKVSVTTALEGFETSQRTFEIHSDGVVDLKVVLRTKTQSDEIVVTDVVELPASTNVSLSYPDVDGASRFCLTAPADDALNIGKLEQEGYMLIGAPKDVSFPSNCVINKAGTRVWVGDRAHDRILSYEHVGSEWDVAADELLDGHGLGTIAMSPSEDTLVAAMFGTVEVYGIAPTGLEHRRSIPIDPVRRMAVLDDLAFASTDTGVYRFSFTGDDPPVLIDDAQAGFFAAPVSDDAAIMPVDDFWRLYQASGGLFDLEGFTSNPGTIVDARAGVPDEGTRSTAPVLFAADQDEAKLMRLRVNLHVPDHVGGHEFGVRWFELSDDERTSGLPAPAALAANPAGQVIATFPYDNTVVAFDTNLGGCMPGPTTACTLGDRFKIEVNWGDFNDRSGPGTVVPGGSEDSELFWFFSPDNWEMMVKTLDGCSFNNHFWVFAAATTNVEYTLQVTDTETGEVQQYHNPLGQASPAITDTAAFATCPGKSLSRHTASSRQPVVAPPVQAAAAGADCTDTGTELCLNDSRYRVEVEWRDFEGRTGSGRVAPLRSADSGVLWFFSANNWEMLIKVLDGCAINDKVWMFSAATTNVEYTLTVTDTETGVMRSYFNPLGQAAPAITDTAAFECDR